MQIIRIIQHFYLLLLATLNNSWSGDAIHPSRLEGVAQGSKLRPRCFWAVKRVRYERCSTLGRSGMTRIKQRC